MSCVQFRTEGFAYGFDTENQIRLHYIVRNNILVLFSERQIAARHSQQVQRKQDFLSNQRRSI